MCGESHHLLNQDNSVKDIEVSKYGPEVCSNLRLKYILDFLSRKSCNSQPERKFHDGLIIFKQKQPVANQVIEKTRWQKVQE
jgi:hypothetical protein